jgi:membrane protein
LSLAYQRFNRVRAAEAAAAIAYYALFSLFPLLLVLTAVLGYILVNAEAPGRVVDFVIQVFPIDRKLIEDNLLQILQVRGTSGIIGLLVLSWSASGVFLTLLRNINRAWPGALIRSVLHGRLLALAMVLILTLLVILAVLGSTLLSVLSRYQIPIRGSVTIYNTVPWRIFTALIPWLSTFLVFFFLYRVGPSTRVRWPEAFWGSLFSTVAWGTTGRIFTWYLSSGLAQFELIYGSLATILILLTWIYLGATITLFGAHISAAVAQVTRQDASLLGGDPLP